MAQWTRVSRERDEFGDSMQVGDLVWSVCPYGVLGRRLAIIVIMDYDDYNPYIIQLVATGEQGRTADRYLVPMDSNKSVKK
tara:strand:+ start:288 stop:530 length:243 start_codon:yes stop_codon:yes gene_type:complete